MTTQKPPPEAKLLDKFSDGISELSYLRSSTSKTLLASSSWDGAVRIHDTNATNNAPLLLTHNVKSGPLLSLAVSTGSSSSSSSDTSQIFTGGLDGSIKSFDVATSVVRSIGSHGSIPSSHDAKSNVSNACSCLSTMSSGNDDPHSDLIISASWNRQLCVWDLRDQNSNYKPAAKATLPGKAFSMDVDASRNFVLVATSGRRNCFFDLRSLKEGEIDESTNNEIFQLDSVLERESSLKFQTRCVKFFPDGFGFCSGSIEGRVGVEFLDELIDSPTKRTRYAFKCHRSVNGLVHPVNAIDFHPKHRHTFATGGCDGTVVLWDGQNKKKLTALPSFPTSISALCFSPDGSELAIASSYTHEEGDREQHPQDELYIRPILDSEATPKQIPINGN